MPGACKTALADADLQKKVHLTSANSINVARWLPQQFYYFYALKQWEGEPPVISVPSGNFGNLASGILTHISGLPVKKFIAACNANDVVPRFLQTADYQPRPSVATLSNAMDVGGPSNFVRILEIFDNNFLDLKDKARGRQYLGRDHGRDDARFMKSTATFSIRTEPLAIGRLPIILKTIQTIEVSFSKRPIR